MRRRQASSGAIVGLALAAWVACGEGGSKTATPAAPAAPPTRSAPAPLAPSAPAPDAARAAAEEIYATRCTTCHGPEGDGKGPGAMALNPGPRDFRDPGWQGSVSDAHIEKIIQYGGGAVGKSPAMLPNPDLVARPEVVAALRAKVRSFGSR